MKFYDKDKKNFVEFNDLFIEQYAQAYFYQANSSTSIKGLFRSSCYPEKEIDRILNDCIKNDEDIVNLLAW